VQDVRHSQPFLAVVVHLVVEKQETIIQEQLVVVGPRTLLVQYPFQLEAMTKEAIDDNSVDPIF
jgi:hypothetical protein